MGANGYTRQPKTEVEKDPAAQAAYLLKINKESLPKLAALRTICETQPEMPFVQAAELANISYNQAQRWRKRGLLDPDNYKLALSIAQRIGPEYQTLIAENAAGLMIEGQRQTLRMLPEANAKQASSIVAEQQQVMHLATGRATSNVVFTTREETIAAMEEAGLLIEAEVVEEEDQAAA